MESPFVEQPIVIYCHINNDGGVERYLVGKHIIPNERFDLMFVTYDENAFDIDNIEIEVPVGLKELLDQCKLTVKAGG